MVYVDVKPKVSINVLQYLSAWLWGLKDQILLWEWTKRPREQTSRFLILLCATLKNGKAKFDTDIFVGKSLT